MHCVCQTRCCLKTKGLVPWCSFLDVIITVKKYSRESQRVGQKTQMNCRETDRVLPSAWYRLPGIDKERRIAHCR
jgi:hypothetical protein